MTAERRALRPFVRFGFPWGALLECLLAMLAGHTLWLGAMALFQDTILMLLGAPFFLLSCFATAASQLVLIPCALLSMLRDPTARTAPHAALLVICQAADLLSAYLLAGWR